MIQLKIINNSDQKGFGLIEMIVAIAIGIVVFVPIVLYLNFSLKIAAEDVSRVEALYLAKSSLEQARSIRDEDWANINALTVGDLYYFEPDASSPKRWVSSAGSDTIGKYTVWVVSSKVYRDGSHNIVPAPGNLDPETLKITASVSYMTRDGERQINLHEYLTNF